MSNSQQIINPCCRACMCENQILHSLCDEAMDQPFTILEMFATTIPQVGIYCNDGLPKMICAPCVNKLISAHEFQQMCVASDTYMRSLLVSNNIIKQEEEINNVGMAQISVKREIESVEQKPQSSCFIKVEPNDENAISEVVFEPTEEYKDAPEWSDGDDIPLKKSGNLKCKPLIKEEFQNCLKFEVGCIEVQDFDLKTSLATRTEKNQAISEAPNDMGADLSSDNDSYTSEHNIATASEWNATDTAANAQFCRKYYNNYRCKQCDAAFDCNKKLQRHSSVHLETNPFGCKICNYRFKRLSALAFHTALKHETSPPEGYKCPECSKQFNKRILFKAHVAKHRTDHLFFKCNLCPKKFQQLKKLTQHERLHPENHKYRCTLCKAAFGMSEQLEDHMNDHCGVKSFACDHCNKEFKNKFWLRDHQRLHTGERPYLCSECGKSFRTKRVLTEHQKRHSSEKTVQCPECPKKFLLDSDLCKHRIQVHRGIKPHSCDICGLSFVRAQSLRTHKLTHTGERPYKCDECNKAFANINNLRAHKLSHAGDKPYKCEHCEKAFIRKGDLQKHTRTHTGEQPPNMGPHNCDICNSSFTRSDSLRKHKKIHTGERPHKCDECDKTFVYIYNLKEHQRTHSGDKPYKCTYCEKSFAANRTLINHIRVHTEEHPYNCNECDLTFADVDNFKAHERMHNADIDSKAYVRVECPEAHNEEQTTETNDTASNELEQTIR